MQYICAQTVTVKYEIFLTSCLLVKVRRYNINVMIYFMTSLMIGEITWREMLFTKIITPLTIQYKQKTMKIALNKIQDRS